MEEALNPDAQLELKSLIKAELAASAQRTAALIAR